MALESLRKKEQGSSLSRLQPVGSSGGGDTMKKQQEFSERRNLLRQTGPLAVAESAAKQTRGRQGLPPAGGQELRQAPPDPEEERRQKLRDIPIVGKVLFGTGKTTPAQRVGGEELADFAMREGAFGFLFEGFQRKVNPTRGEIGERIDNRVTKLQEEGFEPDRALDAAITDVIDETPGIAKNIQDLRDPDVDLTKEEKEALFWTNQIENAFAVVDAPIFLGTTKPLSQIIKKLSKTKTAKEAEELLMKAGVSEDVAKTRAPEAVKLTDETEIEDVIKRASEESKQAPTRTTPDIPPQLAEEARRLAEEARKGTKQFGARYGDEVKEKTVELYRQGMSSKEIESITGIGSDTILRWADDAGIKRTISEATLVFGDDIPKVIKLYEQGKSSGQIAEELNLSRPSVSRWISEAGITRTPSEAQSILAELGKTNVLGVRSKVSTKFGTLNADSTYEAIRIKQLEADPNVVEIKRATRIPLGDGKHYVPDIEVKFKDGSIVIEEIKPVFKLGDEKVIAKEKTAREFLKDKGIGYRIISENDIGVDAFKNVNIDDFSFSSEEIKSRFANAIKKAQIKTKSQLTDIYNRVRGGDEVGAKKRASQSQRPARQGKQSRPIGEAPQNQRGRAISSLDDTIPQAPQVHKTLTSQGRKLVDTEGNVVFPQKSERAPTPLNKPTFMEDTKDMIQKDKQVKKALEGVQKKHGHVDEIIKGLEKKGVTQEELENIVLEDGTRLVDAVKVKRESNGVLSAVITKSDLDEIKNSFTLENIDRKWIPTKTAVQKAKEAGRTGKLAALEYYELPQVFFDRIGLRKFFYDPIREAERNAQKMKSTFSQRLAEEDLYKEGGWFTADRINLSKEEAEEVGRYYLTRQQKNVDRAVSFDDLPDKAQKFVRIFDGIIKETEDRFFKVAELNGKEPGKVENYAPLMTNDDFKLAQEVGDMDYIFRKHPAFFSLKKRTEDVPFELYETDYRQIAARWIDQMANFVHLGEVGPQTKYLANSEELKEVVGDDAFQTINKWVQDTFNPQVPSQAEKGARFGRQAAAIASLGLNLLSVVKQVLTQVPLTIIEKAPPKLKSDFAQKFGIDVKNLPSIKERKGNAAIMDMQEGLKKIAVGPLSQFDKNNAQTSLNALLDKEYKKFLKENEWKEPSQEMQAKIMKEAQDRLDLWYGGMTRSQLPKAFRSEMGKLINMFIHPLTSQLNGFFYSVAKEKGIKQAEKAGEVLASATTIAYLEQTITNFDVEWSDERQMMADVAGSLAGNIPLVSQVVFAFRSDQPLQVSPAISNTWRFGEQLSKSTKGQATAADVGFAFAEMFGTPKQLRRTTQGIYTILDGGLRDKNGKLLAPVSGTDEQIRAFIRGKYGTHATQDYIRNVGTQGENRRWFVPEVEFLQNGDYERKAELFQQFDVRTQRELYDELSDGQQKRLDTAIAEQGQIGLPEIELPEIELEDTAIELPEIAI